MKSLPERIRLPNGDTLRVVLIRVWTTYPDGTPEDLTHVPMDVPIELGGDDQFTYAYVPEEEFYKS